MPDNYESMVADLKAIGIPFAEHAWTTRPKGSHYGVVSMDFEGESDEGDNRKENRSWEGSVDLFSSDKHGGGYPNVIEGILEEYCECAWEQNGPTWEPETSLFHWEWTFRLEALEG